jgi:uncharacterized membrane protein YtjA (UPF0391 family)
MQIGSTAKKRKVRFRSEAGGYRCYTMLFLFRVVALVAALLGFWGIAGVAANIASIVCCFPSAVRRSAAVRLLGHMTARARVNSRQG